MLNHENQRPPARNASKAKNLSRSLLSDQARIFSKGTLQNQRLWIFAYALLFAETLLLFLAMRWGPGISPDSVNYAKAADDFRENLPMAMVDGSPLSLWPPLYPALLGTLSDFGGRISSAAILLNIASLWVAGISFTYIILRIQLTHFWRVLAISFFTLSSSQHLVFRMVWSEGFFIAIVMLSLALFMSNQLSVLKWNTSAMLIGLGVVASFTKYIGLAVFLAVGCGIIAQIVLHRQKLREALIHVILVFFGAALVTPLFMGTSGENSQPLGARLPSESTFMSLIREMTSLSGSYLVEPLRGASAIAVGSAVIALCSIGVVRALVGKKWGLLVSAMFLGFFWALTFLGKLLFLTDTLDFRLGSPAFGPSLIFFFIGLEGVTRFIGRQIRSLLPRAKWQPIISRFRWGVVPLCVYIIASLGGLTFSVANEAQREGIWLNSRSFQQSDLFEAVKNWAPQESVFLSRRPELIYWHTGKIAKRIDRNPSRNALSNVSSGSVLIQVGNEELKLLPILLEENWNATKTEFSDGAIWVLTEPLT